MNNTKCYTSEMLMHSMGLSVGDRIKINNKDNTYIIELNEYDEPIYIEEYTKIKFPIADLLNKNVEILPTSKKVGDLKCEEIGGSINCPLRFICDCSVSTKNNLTLYQILKLKSDNSYQDKEIHDLLKNRLNKEISEVNVMGKVTKKIKDLTINEIIQIAKKYKGKCNKECPLYNVKYIQCYNYCESCDSKQKDIEEDFEQGVDLDE